LGADEESGEDVAFGAYGYGESVAEFGEWVGDACVVGESAGFGDVAECTGVDSLLAGEDGGAGKRSRTTVWRRAMLTMLEMSAAMA
jgi:hypothetical protein